MKEEALTYTETKSISMFVYKFIKRLFDILVSLIDVIFMIPLTIIIKIVSICTGDFGPIFFTQSRIGKDGKEFKFYKYRSMVMNADEILFKMLKENKKLAAEYKTNKKLKDDPRITKVGKFLRRTSLDELPQIFNILKGDMTLIGNRPYLPREKEDMGESFRDIVKTKPGLTGYWQVSGRNNTTFKKRLELERFYSNHCSLSMDIKIFFKTFIVVFHGKGCE